MRHISEAQKPELTWRQNLGHKGADAEAELRGGSRPCGGVVVALLPANQLPSWWAGGQASQWLAGTLRRLRSAAGRCASEQQRLSLCLLLRAYVRSRLRLPVAGQALRQVQCQSDTVRAADGAAGPCAERCCRWAASARAWQGDAWRWQTRCFAATCSDRALCSISLFNASGGGDGENDVRSALWRDAGGVRAAARLR